MTRPYEEMKVQQLKTRLEAGASRSEAGKHLVSRLYESDAMARQD